MEALGLLGLEAVVKEPTARAKGWEPDFFDRLLTYIGKKERKKVRTEYVPSTNYEQEYQELVDRICELDVARYREATDWYVDGLTISMFPFPRKMNLKPLLKPCQYRTIPEVENSPEKKEKCRQSWERVKGTESFHVLNYYTETCGPPPGTCQNGYTSGVFFEELSPEQANQLFYVSWRVGEDLFTKRIVPDNERWKSGRPLVSQEYQKNFTAGTEKLPYDSQTREFVFFGAEGCNPCYQVRIFLADNYIRWREVIVEEGQTPRMHYQDQEMVGLDEVTRVVREMYGIKKEK